jgi:hypothetical protein
MKSKLDLSSYGVEEMSQQEMLNVEGGNPVGFAIGFCIGMAIDSLYQAVTGESISDTGASLIKRAWSSHMEIMEKYPMSYIY